MTPDELVPRQSVEPGTVAIERVFLAQTQYWDKRRSATRSNVLVPLVAAGIALSGSALGATAINANSGTAKANICSSNTRGPQYAQGGVQHRLVLRTSPEVNNFGGSPAMAPKGD